MEDVGAGTAAANFTGSDGGGASVATTSAAGDGGDGGDGGDASRSSSAGLEIALFFKSLMSTPRATIRYD